jgi:hypothetical protein
MSSRLTALASCPLREGHVDGAFGTTGQADDAVEAFASQPVELCLDAHRHRPEDRARHQAREVAETRPRSGRHQHDAGFAGPGDMSALADPLFIGSEIDGQLHPHQGLNALLGRLLGEFQRTEQIAGVGNAQCGLFVGLGQLENGSRAAMRPQAVRRQNVRADG